MGRRLWLPGHCHSGPHSTAPWAGVGSGDSGDSTGLSQTTVQLPHCPQEDSLRKSSATM